MFDIFSTISGSSRVDGHVMGDAYDELDMMLEEPYRAKSGRYDRVSLSVSFNSFTDGKNVLNLIPRSH